MKKQKSVPEMLDYALGSYHEFIAEVAANHRVICISTPLPTIPDGVVCAVGGARREVTTPQKEKTVLTLEFNARTQAFCQENGIDYIMLDDVTLGENGLVIDEVKHKDLADHHYDDEAFAHLLIPRLRELLPANLE